VIYRNPRLVEVFFFERGGYFLTPNAPRATFGPSDVSGSTYLVQESADSILTTKDMHPGKKKFKSSLSV
jgi:hypothetical protein